MKHALLLITISITAYGLWQVADKKERKAASTLITRHALRIGAIVLLIVFLLFSATYLQSTSII